MTLNFNISNQTKGYLFALLATISFSNVYIFSKAALNEVSLAQFWLYWFAIAFAGNLVFSLSTRSIQNLKDIPRPIYKNFLLLGFLEIITTSSFFISIQIIPDPSIASFLGNMYMVFLVVLGVIMLKEKFSRNESFGVAITLLGAFAVGYKGGNALKDFFIPGSGIVLFNAFMAAFTSIIAKKTIQKIGPPLVNLNRTFFLFLAAIIFISVQKDSLNISAHALANITIGALLGPVLGLLAVYYSFKYIEASRSSVIQGLKGLFVLIGSFLYFGLIPNTLTLIGGLISVIGVLIMAIAKGKIKKNKIR